MFHHDLRRFPRKRNNVMLLVNITGSFFNASDLNSQQAMHQAMHLIIIGVRYFLDISVITFIKCSFLH